MLFQALDNKDHCVGVYANGELIYDEFPSDLDKTWSYAPGLASDRIEYASLYAQGAPLDTCCPPFLKERYDVASKRLRAYLRSFYESKVDLDELCFFDLVPRRFLLEYCEVKNQITDHVLSTYAKPSNYDFLVSVMELAHSIEQRKLNIDPRALIECATRPKGLPFFKKVRKTKPYVRYNIFGTVTGRLTTRKGSFPILTFQRECRNILRPNNSHFVEMDFNAAEIRTLMALNNIPQPHIDIHDWIRKEVFNNQIGREESKVRTFAWLYNPDAANPRLEAVFDKNKVLETHWDGKKIHTPFGRTIPADEKHALNYLIQSTTSDLVLQQAIKIHDHLRESKSYVAFCVHDSLVLDYSKDDQEQLQEIYRLFSDTLLGTFKASISAGKNYGTMKK